LAAGSAHPGTYCPDSYTNKTQQLEFCLGYGDGAAHPPLYNSKGEIICDNSIAANNSVGCGWYGAVIQPCIHGPPNIPDKNGNCPILQIEGKMNPNMTVR